MCSLNPAAAGPAPSTLIAHATSTTTTRAAARRARIVRGGYRCRVSLAAMSIRVVVAEDNYLVREAVTRLLEASPDIEVAGVAEDFDGLLAAVETDAPDVVLTDIRMPPTGTDEGVRAAAQLRQSHPQ